jgi:hypothetical protein
MKPSTGGNDRGTVLFLFPTAFMVMLVLAAITIDVSLSHLRANELQDVAASAANDALGAIDIVALRNTGRAQFNQSEIVRIANQTVAASNLPDAQVVNVVLNDPDSLYPQLRVTLRLRVALLMTPMVPGAPHQTTITRTGTVSIFGFDYLQPG